VRIFGDVAGPGSYRFSKLVANILIIFSLALWGILFFLARPAADDYCAMSNVSINGSVKTILSYISTGTPNYSAFSLLFIPLELSTAPVIFNVLLILLFLISVIMVGYSLRILHIQDIRVQVIACFITSLIILNGGYFNETLGWYSFFWLSSVVVHTIVIPFGFLALALISSGRVKSITFTLFLAFILNGFSPVEAITFGLISILLSLFTIRSKREISVKGLIFGGSILIMQVVVNLLPSSTSRFEAFTFKTGFFERFKEAIIFHLAGIIEVKSILFALSLGVFLGIISKENQLIPFRLVPLLAFGFCSSLVLTSIGEARSYRAVWHGVLPSLLFHVFLVSIAMCLFLLLFSSKLSRILRMDLVNYYLILISLVAIFSLVAPLQLMQNRMNSWDTRWIAQETSQLVSVPIVTRFGNQLLADTESDWVKGCFVGWKGAK
jgi:hypothetical protein